MKLKSRGRGFQIGEDGEEDDEIFVEIFGNLEEGRGMR